MSKLNYFDCNAMIGRYFNPAVGRFLTATTLEEEYDYFGVSEGLVYHASAKEYFPPLGNQALIKELKGSQRLHPAWVITPHHTREMPGPNEVVQGLKENGIKVVRIFCSRWCYANSLDPFIFSELLEVLQHHRLPVMVEFDMGEGGSVDSRIWRDLHSVCTSFRGLRVILASPKSTGLNRALFPLFEKHEHFALETSGYQGLGGLEAVVELFGASRLLFGSRAPYMDIGPGMVALQYAELNPEDKELIAGGNLRRLLSEVML
jgi:hypothetical protein